MYACGRCLYLLAEVDSQALFAFVPRPAAPPCACISWVSLEEIYPSFRIKRVATTTKRQRFIREKLPARDKMANVNVVTCCRVQSLLGNVPHQHPASRSTNCSIICPMWMRHVPALQILSTPWVTPIRTSGYHTIQIYSLPLPLPAGIVTR